MTPAEHVARFSEFIRTQARDQKITQKELARRMDRSHDLIVNIIGGKQKNGGTVMVLCEAMKVLGFRLEIVKDK